MAVLPLCLFPDLGWWQLLLSSEEVQIELFENWVKQSGRTRYEILSPHGRQMLIVPTIKESRKGLSDVLIDRSKPWNTQHWRALETSYNKSPFFEFYRDELHELLFSDEPFLTKWSMSCLQWLRDKVLPGKELACTIVYQKVVPDDWRYKDTKALSTIEYDQLFSDRLGFIPNLSLLDLLFHCGPESGSILCNYSK